MRLFQYHPFTRGLTELAVWGAIFTLVTCCVATVAFVFGWTVNHVLSLFES